MDPGTAAFAVIIWTIRLCGLALIVWLSFVGIRGMYRYYRDCKPSRMATDLRPQRDSRDWQRQFREGMKS